MQSADVAPQAPASGENQGTAFRVIGPRTFVYQDGVWVDTTFDPDTMQRQALRFLSDDYFRLLDARPDLAAALALGDRVTVVVDGSAYQVVGEDETGGPVVLPPEITEEPTLPSAAPTATPREQAQATADTIQPTKANPNEIAAAPTDAGPKSPARTCLSGFLLPALILVSAWILRLRR